VQQKLNLLLQPQPNKIRPKGDTKVLRRLLLECSKLQRTRRIRKQQHRNIDRLERREAAPLDADTVEGSGRVALPSTTEDVADCANVTDIEPHNCEHRLLDMDAFGLPSASLVLSGQDCESFFPSDLSFSHDGSHTGHSNPILDDCTEIPVWSRLDSGLQPQSPIHLDEVNDLDYLVYPPIDYNDGLDGLFPDDTLDSKSDPPIPDLGFDSDFGPKPVSKLSPTPSTPPSSETIEGLSSSDKINGRVSGDTANQSGKLSASRDSHTGCPAVNSAHFRDTFDSADFLLPAWHPCYNSDAMDIIPLEGGPNQDQATVEDSPSVRQSLPNIPDSMSIVDGSCLSRPPSSSSSKISSFLSKMSLGSFQAIDGQISPGLTSSLSMLSLETESPIILPGAFPEYCWQHLNKNRLLRCDELDENQTCYAKHYCTSKPTFRSLRADIFSRIVQHTIRPKDVHEVDTFGNSIIHIAASLLAPPSYLISLINMGADVNSLNNAGQTFLHLIKPEVLEHRNDFCQLLEILTIRGFNFSQQDPLGQTPLHLLLRPWIRSDILHAIITQLDTLLVHRQMSTGRDCFGYTVIGQMNMQGAESSELNIAEINLEQAILSLACETETRIADPNGLQFTKSNSYRKDPNSKNEPSARNYENHPSIKTVEDLLKYEQHVDFWRTIVAAKHSPSVEDSNGRNGLHCLAESSPVSPDMPLPSALMDQVERFRNTVYADGSDHLEGFVKALLAAGVDPNNYDKNGNTPLMAFVSNDRATENDESITRVLALVLEAGSDIGRRNRQGETALHITVKLGRRAATGTLLAHGANVHARTRSGLGVLELGQRQCLENKDDENLFGQIMVCMSLAASFEAVSGPTILDEWGSPKWRLHTQKCTESKGFKLVKKFIGAKARGRRGGKKQGVKTSVK